MDIKIVLDKSLEDGEIIIKVKEIDEKILRIKDFIGKEEKSREIVFFKDEVEYFIDLDDILFFESYDSSVRAHTKDDIYIVKYRLYRLEEILPSNYMRASKSSIVNLDKLISLERSITSSSTVGFEGTHKKTYVSRKYFNEFKERLIKRKRGW